MRESLFGSLEAQDLVAGARVLDLYAGSGALGLECASRGAASVDLVEKSRPAAGIAAKNAAKVATAAGVAARVHATGVEPFLRTSSATWDLVLMDPPYDVSDAEVTAVLTGLSPRLSPDAVVIVERAKRSAAPAWGEAGLEPLRDRTFGDTRLWWGQPRVSSQS